MSTNGQGGNEGGNAESPADEMTQEEKDNALDLVIGMYPWLSDLDFITVIKQMIQDGITDPTSILTEIRQTPAHARMFPSFRREDGTLRFAGEKAYLDRIDNYKQVMQRFGRDPREYGPHELSKFMENEIDPNELNERFEIYDQVRVAGRDIRDAFYVYSGKRLSDDDLYEYIVDGDARARFDEEYNRRVTASPVDYETFITRATEAGLERVVEALEGLQADGIAVEGAISVVRNLDPDFARQLADLLYQGSAGEVALGTLGDLTNTFQLALIGGAASSQGLGLPDAARISAFRDAGVNRARAIEGYSLYARDRNALKGQVARLNQGNRFGQADFENAVFLQSAEAQSLLERAQGREESFGDAEGAASFQNTRAGIAQPGLTGKY